MTKEPVNRNITIEDAKIGSRNFAGKAKRYNEKGKRNFLLLLPTDVAEALAKEEYWPVKWLKPRDPEENEPQAFLAITVRFDPVPPRVVLITGGGRNDLDEDTVEILDWVRIKNVDLIITPYEWEMKNDDGSVDRGVKPYLKSIYVTIEEDDLEKKYREMPVDDAPPSIEEMV